MPTLPALSRCSRLAWQSSRQGTGTSKTIIATRTDSPKRTPTLLVSCASLFIRLAVLIAVHTKCFRIFLGDHLFYGFILFKLHLLKNKLGFFVVNNANITLSSSCKSNFNIEIA